MEEQLISFETAKLAKDKRFKVWTEQKYVERSYGVVLSRTYEEIGEPAPTQSLLQKWLRETHGIHIELIMDGWEDDNNVSKDIIYRAFIWQVGKHKPAPHEDLGASEKYEHILEIALQKALELI